MKLDKSERETVLRSMSETDIRSYLKNNPKFGGVFSNDELKNPDPKKIYILNLEDSDENGSHWTVLHNGVYYDSYGVLPTKRIAKFVREYNTQNFQGLMKSSCGYYSLYVVDNLSAGRAPYHGMIEGAAQKNEDILKKYFF